MQLQWTGEYVPTPQTLPYKTQTFQTTVEWTLTGPSSFPGGPKHSEGYTLWLQPPVGAPMDVLAMPPHNLGYLHAEFIATIPGPWCGQWRAVGTYVPPGESLTAPSVIAIKPKEIA